MVNETASYFENIASNLGLSIKIPRPGKNMTYAVEVNESGKTIRTQTTLNNIYMRVKSGEIYGFSGANGAGKTSLMKSLYQMMIPDCCTVRLFGETVGRGRNMLAEISMSDLKSKGASLENYSLDLLKVITGAGRSTQLGILPRERMGRKAYKNRNANRMRRHLPGSA